MANKPLKPCNKMGCNALTRDSYCESHAYLKVEYLKESRKFYDNYKKDKKITNFYNSPPWKMVRLKALERDLYMCVNCRDRGRYSRATSVHHIVKIKDNWELRLSLNNLKSLCEKCHKQEDMKSIRRN